MSAPLRTEELLAALAARRATQGDHAGLVGRRIEVHATLASTNDRARELAASGEPEGTVVVAETQTRGRGRLARTWHSPPGVGLYMSAILRPVAPPDHAPLFGLVAAVATATALSRLAARDVRIKWPNDVVVEEPSSSRRLKLAGILTEARAGEDLVRDLVVGIGVNVNHAGRDFPAEIAARATSLRILRGRPLDRSDVAAEILTSLDDWYNLWGREGEAPILETFRAMALDLVGRRVRVSGAGAPWEGTTAGLTDDGALRVAPGTGAPAVEVRYGEVLRVEEA